MGRRSEERRPICRRFCSRGLPAEPVVGGKRGRPRLLATPHVAFYSEQSVAELATLAARNVATVLAGGRAVDTVNRQVYEKREMTR